MSDAATGTTVAARVPLASLEHSARPPTPAWTTRASMATALSLATVRIHAFSFIVVHMHFHMSLPYIYVVMLLQQNMLLCKHYSSQT